MKTINTVKTTIVRCASLLGIGALVLATSGIAPAKADGLNISIGINHGRVIGGGIAYNTCAPVPVVVSCNDVVVRRGDRFDHDRNVRFDRDHCRR